MTAPEAPRVLRVMQVVTKSEFGGAQTQVASLTSGLVEAGHAVCVVAGEPGPLLDAARALGAETAIVDQLGSMSPGNARRAFVALRRLVAQWQPDVVHCHSSHAGLVSRFVAARTGTRCLYTAHGFQFKRQVALPRRAVAFVGEMVAARLPGHTICINSDELDRARRWLRMPQARLHCIATAVEDHGQPEHHGADLGRRMATGVPIVVTVARLAPPKRVDVVIDAVALIDAGPELVVVGSGPQLEQLTTQAIEAGIEAAFLGDRADVEEILAGADVFVLCSDHEGAPISVLEAMRAGLPVVVTGLPGTREQLGQAGCFVSNEPAEVAAALEELLASPDLRRSIGAANRLRFETLYTAEQMLAAVLDVYEALLA